VQQPDDEVVETQAHEGDEHERTVLTDYLHTLALEGPETVPEVVIRGGEDETEGVTEVFVPMQFLLA
jgi:hypothetical protein